MPKLVVSLTYLQGHLGVAHLLEVRPHPRQDVQPLLHRVCDTQASIAGFRPSYFNRWQAAVADGPGQVYQFLLVLKPVNDCRLVFADFGQQFHGWRYAGSRAGRQ